MNLASLEVNLRGEWCCDMINAINVHINDRLHANYVIGNTKMVVSTGFSDGGDDLTQKTLLVVLVQQGNWPLSVVLACYKAAS